MLNRKYESIDLLQFYKGNNVKKWNTFLTDCALHFDINSLVKIRYQLQAGMTDLANQNLNTEEMNVWFLRLMKSIEKTARHIIRKKHPLPGDNPTQAKKNLSYIDQKRKRDEELSSFLSRSAF